MILTKSSQLCKPGVCILCGGLFDRAIPPFQRACFTCNEARGQQVCVRQSAQQLPCIRSHQTEPDLCSCPVWISCDSIAAASAEEGLQYRCSKVWSCMSNFFPRQNKEGTADASTLCPTIWSMSFLGGTVGMPSNGNSMVAISSNTSAWRRSSELRYGNFTRLSEV